jgi:hypothetical protein
MLLEEFTRERSSSCCVKKSMGARKVSWEWGKG